MKRLLIAFLIMSALPLLTNCGGNGYAAGSNDGALIGGSILKFPMQEQK